MSLEEAAKQLRAYQEDPEMNTPSQYSPTAEEWPNHRLPFVEVHMAYLRSHKNVNPAHYLSNLRLMIRIVE